MKKKVLSIACIGCICIAILAVFFGLFAYNEYTVELNVKDGDKVFYEAGTDPKEVDLTAICKGTIFNRKGIPLEVIIDGDVDYTTLGEYTVNVKAAYKDAEAMAKVVIVVEDTLPPVIELVSDPNYYTNPAFAYEEEGYVAKDNYDGILTDKVIRQELDGKVLYTVTDSCGNTASVERIIQYKDLIAPVIALQGEQEMILDYGAEFVEPGWTATDECDGDISQNVEVEGKVNSDEPGEYTYIYTVTDSSGNIGTIRRKITVLDVSGPNIILTGGQQVYLKLGSTYSESGYQALDNADGDLTSKVTVSGTVDTSRCGNYKITYSVTDSSGNASTIVRSVYVYEKQAENVVVNPGDKVVYLTFDDGPSKHTATLLDILDKYGVKATFFVTAQFPSSEYLIKETFDRGHTVALHTYSHEYSDIYKSTEAYYADLQKIHDIVYRQTGQHAWLVRFPGGTANTISKRYCPGIMTTLSQGLGYHGYLYCDWNVTSQDAGGTTSTSQIVQNVTSGISKRNVSIVLQHDIYKYSVDAVEEIICWGLANGYKFLPMDESTPMIHQTVYN
jgi:peptidoglycan/xylan/chitin deacetylase (PgdA/CDA1 family)